RLFDTNPSAEALTEGVRFLRIVAPFYCVICIKLMADGVLRGAGSMTYFMVATFGDLVLRVILAYALSPVFGAAGIWMSWPIGWVLAAVLSMGFYLRGVWLPRSAKKR
ncbi:MAG: MATE family efflux transporter, partial [Ruthenibacterium sp.]